MMIFSRTWFTITLRLLYNVGSLIPDELFADAGSLIMIECYIRVVHFSSLIIEHSGTLKALDYSLSGFTPVFWASAQPITT